MLYKGHRKYRQRLPVKAWLAIALLLFNQLALALHVHDADDHVRVHQCAVCMQLQSGEHAALIKCDLRLPEPFEDTFHLSDSNTFITAARLIPRSRAPPVAFG
ncbi:MAG TPA: hypothetical protein VF268_09365 [Gammaproteobacteria bacterium]